MNQSNPFQGEARRDRLIKEQQHDPYGARGKLHEPTLCTRCGAVYRKGRWQWAEQPPAEAETALCQACRRIEDGYPAGELTLSGGFLAEHKDEILSLARNTEKLESGEHAMHRIMAIDEAAPERIAITTTDIHLPRRIGQAIADAYAGDFDVKYDEEGYFVRVTWHRDA